MGWSTAGCKSHSSSVILLSPCEIYISSSFKLYMIVYNIFNEISFSLRNPLTSATNPSPLSLSGEMAVGL